MTEVFKHQVTFLKPKERERGIVVKGLYDRDPVKISSEPDCRSGIGNGN